MLECPLIIICGKCFDKAIRCRIRGIPGSGDVIATQGLLEWLTPYLPNPPALRVDGKDYMTTCHRCGHDTKPIPRRYVANLLTYSMRRCTQCGGYSRISVEPERLSIVRSV